VTTRLAARIWSSAATCRRVRLSSSASLEVAVGTVFQQLYHLPLDGTQIALNGQEAENQFVGCNCGIMDQLSRRWVKRQRAADRLSLAGQQSGLHAGGRRHRHHQQ
jgi:hypothetical protein